MGGHVLQECMSSGWHIFQDHVFHWSTFSIGGQVLLEGMSYRRSTLKLMPNNLIVSNEIQAG